MDRLIRAQIAVLLTVLGVLFLFVLDMSPVFADSSSSLWLLPSSPTLERQDLGAGEVPYSINGNIGCRQQKLILKPRVFKPIFHSEISRLDCVVDTDFGAVGNDSFAQLSGTPTAGRLQSSDGAYNVIAIPSSSSVMHYKSASTSGMNLSFSRSVSGALEKILKSDGLTDYRLKRPATEHLTDKAGKLIPVQYDSISFSENGQWMVADSVVVGKVRVNLETLEVLPFGMVTTYDGGVSPQMKTAISSDGRYAVVASAKLSLFRLYDLSTCSPVPNSIIGPASCQSANLYAYIISQLSGFTGASSIRFVTNHTIKFYGSHFPSGSRQISQFFLSAPGQSITRLEYLALGDSFASGEGVHSYKIGTDTKQNKCHLSSESYPYLLGTWLGLNSFESVACSGATTNDINNKDEDYLGQHGTVENIATNNRIALADFNPGYLAQREFINHYRPDVITVSAIGNDIGFSNKITRCIEPDTCYATYEDRVEILREIRGKFDKLTALYSELKNSASHNTKIYVLSYPDIVKPGGDCALNVHLDSTELEFAQQLVGQLNEVIEQAAKYSGVYYVDLEDAFVGYRLCETVSSNIAVNGLTGGNDIVRFLGGPIGNESYHPNRAGHQLFRRSILEKTSDFSAGMPLPDRSIQVPSNETGLAFLDMPRSGREILKTNYDEALANDVVFRDSSWGASVAGAKHALTPSSVTRVRLHSEPIDLGEFTTDSEGNLDISLRLPADVPLGQHTLHIYAQNLAGENIDIYKTIYVVEEVVGDDGLDKEKVCVVVQPAGTDVDQDDTDDACDGLISDPPPTPDPDEESGDTNIGNTDESSQGSNSTPQSFSTIETLPTLPESQGVVAADQTLLIPDAFGAELLREPSSLAQNNEQPGFSIPETVWVAVGIGFSAVLLIKLWAIKPL